MTPTTMLPPTLAQSLPRTEVRPGAASPDVKMINGVQDVDLAKGVSDGIALPDVRGIELDTEMVVRSEHLEFERFMHEIVSVQMMPQNNENDHKFAEITVNGQYRCLMMGEQYDIPRTHLAVLANAKSMRVEQEKLVNPDGSIGFREKAVLRQMYPFTVAHDPNPKGGVWLMKLLKNPS